MITSMNYYLLDQDGLCINAVNWDGGDGWSPPEGVTLVSQALSVGRRYGYDAEQEQWVDLDPPPFPQPQPQWVQFGAALAADVDVNAMVSAAASTAPVLHLMLGVGLGQAAQGDPQTFSVAWSNARTAGLVTPDLAAHVAAVGASHNLPAEFLDSINAPEPDLTPLPEPEPEAPAP